MKYSGEVENGKEKRWRKADCKWEGKKNEMATAKEQCECKLQYAESRVEMCTDRKNATDLEEIKTWMRFREYGIQTQVIIITKRCLALVLLLRFLLHFSVAVCCNADRMRDLAYAWRRRAASVRVFRYICIGHWFICRAYFTPVIQAFCLPWHSIRAAFCSLFNRHSMIRFAPNLTLFGCSRCLQLIFFFIRCLLSRSPIVPIASSIQ